MTQLLDNSIVDVTLATKESAEESIRNLISLVSHRLDDQCKMQICKACRTYTSPSISYIVLEIIEQSARFQRIHEETAIKAFQRLVISIAGENSKECNAQITVALYEFVTFTEAYGWQLLFFNVAERIVPILRSQGLEVVKQDFQESEFRYLAYRKPISAMLNGLDSD